MKAKFAESFRLTWSLLREQALPLFGLFIVGCSFTMTVEDATLLLTPAQDTERYLMQLSLGVWELVEWVIMLLILSWGVPKVHKFKAKDLLHSPFETPYLSSYLAEFLRMLAQIVLWLLALLVGAFVRFGQLIFVPYIALFSKSYRAGDVNAMRLSEKLVKGRLFFILAILFVTDVLGFCLQYAPEYFPDYHTLPFRVASDILVFLLSVWNYSLIFVLFESYLVAAEEK